VFFIYYNQFSWEKKLKIRREFIDLNSNQFPNTVTLKRKLAWTFVLKKIAKIVSALRSKIIPTMWFSIKIEIMRLPALS